MRLNLKKILASPLFLSFSTMLAHPPMEDIDMVAERSKVSPSDKWNVESFYPSIQKWSEQFQQKVGNSQWKEVLSFKGKLEEGPSTIANLLSCFFETERALVKLYTYAHLRHDEDVADTAHKEAYSKAMQSLHQFQQEVSWIEPELLKIPSEKMEKFLASSELAPYRVYLQRIVRFKPHTLSEQEENLLAASSQALETAEKAFGAFNNADMKFPSILNGKGESVELTQGKYMTYLRSPDRVLRKNAVEAMNQTYKAHENTLCELIQGVVQKHLFYAKARKFSTCLEAALFPHQIEPQVYHNLIQTVRAHLPVLHAYMQLRKQVLGLETLHPYDLHVPLVEGVDLKMSYEEAVDSVIEATAPLGPDYQGHLKKGLKNDRWVDRFENVRKRSGAYSSGCYDSMPYILMNYEGNFQDAMTLAHEAGHSMHSLFTWKTQPYHLANYPIFVAEVASTFNEELLHKLFVKKTEDKKTKAFLIWQKIEDIRNTLFRQTMFAEFELKVHSLAEQGIPITPALLKAEYKQLNADYFGQGVVLDADIEMEWARIPHFYYNFYVYQYATGISAAHALIEVVGKEGPQNYLHFLSSGSSDYPIELLKQAGVDMKQPKAIESTLSRFGKLTTELKNLLM